MTRDQIKAGQRVRQIDHPEYGEWTIMRHYHEGTWEVRGQRGEIAVSDTELMRFWEIVE